MVIGCDILVNPLPPPRNISWYVNDDFLERQRAELIQRIESGGGRGGGGGIHVTLHLPTAVFFFQPDGKDSTEYTIENDNNNRAGNSEDYDKNNNYNNNNRDRHLFIVDSAEISVTLKISGYYSVGSATIAVIAASEAEILNERASTSSSSLESLWGLNGVDAKALVFITASIFIVLLVILVALLLCGGGGGGGGRGSGIDFGCCCCSSRRRRQREMEDASIFYLPPELTPIGSQKNYSHRNQDDILFSEKTMTVCERDESLGEYLNWLMLMYDWYNS